MPFISVILPLYNEREDWIRLSISSILNQSYSDFELFLINDNPNNSVITKIVLEYQKLDFRVVAIINKENIGLPASLNKTILLSSGKYIARMDGDDISHPNRLEKQVDFLENNLDYSICGTFGITIDENGKKGKPIRLYSSNEYLKSTLLFYSPFIHPSVVFRREFIINNLYNENFKTGQDSELWLRCAKYTKYYNIPEELIFYRIQSTSITRSQSLKKLAILKFLAEKYTSYWDIENEFKKAYISLRISPKALSLCEVDALFKYLLEFVHDKIMFKIICRRYFRILYDRKFILHFFYNPLFRFNPIWYIENLLNC